MLSTLSTCCSRRLFSLKIISAYLLSLSVSCEKSACINNSLDRPIVEIGVFSSCVILFTKSVFTSEIRFCRIITEMENPKKVKIKPTTTAKYSHGDSPESRRSEERRVGKECRWRRERDE